MKKLFLFLSVLAISGTINAQKAKSPARKSSTASAAQTAEGKFLIEANTGFGPVHSADTSFGFTSRDGSSNYNLGLEGGYFFMDDLAVKVGLGYGGYSIKDGPSSNAFSYKIGAKYYIMSMIPVQIDYSGAKVKDVTDNESFIGAQVGYAIFLGDNVSIEPGFRYNKALLKDAKDILEFKVGFALHF